MTSARRARGTTRRSGASSGADTNGHASWPEHSPGDIDTFVADRALMLIDYALQSTTADEAADTRVFIRKEVRHLRRWLSG